MSNNEGSGLRAPRVDADIRASIEDLMSDYAYALDDDALERWPEFFTDAGTYKIISRDNHEAGMALGILSCDGRGMFAQDRNRDPRSPTRICLPPARRSSGSRFRPGPRKTATASCRR